MAEDKDLKTTKKSPNWNKDESSPILKIMVLPISFIIASLGIMVILGGHITPGGGFQGGAMIAGAIILSVVVYTVNGSPLKLSHRFISLLESVGALAYVLLGLAGLALTGSFLYNVGGNLYGLVPQAIAAIFKYPDLTNAGMVPYLNIAVGLKVLVGLSAIVIAFSQFKKLAEEE
ncbi:energy-converting hydrogenase B subunit I EhbI [Methanobrevibacter ruminantium M1]|uniref:Energy-converting hydrogenase B subunit I EhbI n=1 Tax=Methanobrevibacter ruminantium (strain ATCC 35063 / DSM 1093 / JCM 13430 / OCM 146 / M1) TaxID=634498 RepID=D3E0D2_METRM|nr:MnhB domain-containing protein [Methanobrevibacter ruminantium]ADC47856.1 energy-converting hydrogenase B subunit I EhbI [Methanobrevibacter ruminantium M1]